MQIQESAIYQTLKEYFGYESFRPYQLEIIKAVLGGKDQLVIMPTGGGKSICYQLPALLLPKTTIVISPLIALMKDQVDALKANGIAAEYYNSSQSADVQNAIFHQVVDGKIKVLYVAPESLQLLSNILKEDYISCIAIDEAHCISSWGHDFRPSYQQLGFLKKKLPNLPIIALTATADKTTREDIVHQLTIPDAIQSITSFDRKNISIEVRPADKRVEQIVSFIQSRPNESGIIYCLSRKGTEQIADKLKDKGIDAAAYHAGLSAEKRSKVQEDFVRDKLPIVSATIAFGMGIDKSNVRWVIHHNMPKNLEGYYQEIGRAGRDGLPSRALLFNTYADLIQLRKFTEGTPNEELQLAKLERMKQFADATTCRKKILLSYFGELREDNCGNCDNCKNPPQLIDGTIIAQKALSTIVRVNQTEPIGMIANVLIGSNNAQVAEKGYQSVKTYGIGKDISWKDWQHYITQLVNQGLCEIAFHRGNALQLTELSGKVLFEGQQVELSKPFDVRKVKVVTKDQPVPRATDKNLYERLRKLRLQIASEAGVPPYVVFSDATLKEMEQARPQTEEAFLEINGVGQHKLKKYGQRFLDEITDYEQESVRKQADTFKVTYEMYQEGLSVQEIARRRDLQETTIYSHLAKLFNDGKPIDLYKYISEAEVKAINEAKKKLESPDALKPYYDHFKEEMPYYKIRLGLTLIEMASTAK
ncbi:MAG: DNA helicase RecQ [Bacteroidota bacterium]